VSAAVPVVPEPRTEESEEAAPSATDDAVQDTPEVKDAPPVADATDDQPAKDDAAASSH
jgi:hypothetical protein